VILIGLGIIEKKGKVLIEKRKGKDEHVVDLTWVFPGGKIESLDFKSEIKREIKEETNIDVDVKNIIHARLIPDSPDKKTNIVALYFHCKYISGKEKMGKEVSELKWVKPTTVSEYFTTSTCDTVMRFLEEVEMTKK
jgi:8-oxo-dGTP pyrophosphatase MutT (NUDIX family)